MSEMTEGSLPKNATSGRFEVVVPPWTRLSGKNAHEQLRLQLAYSRIAAAVTEGCIR
jgi:hypothetical protein